jgi:hypothetical protein
MRFESKGVGFPNFIMSLSFRYSVHHTVFPIVVPEHSHIQRKKGCLKGSFPPMSKKYHAYTDIKEQSCKQWSMLVKARHGNEDIQSKII